ncbi:hypothetical protein K377_07237 [Streptomyces sp. PsTaAH-137]|nr:hypothetical protein K377_07237 [Streptomyces sp. PsTaAH-137]
MHRHTERLLRSYLTRRNRASSRAAFRRPSTRVTTVKGQPVRDDPDATLRANNQAQWSKSLLTGDDSGDYGTAFRDRRASALALLERGCDGQVLVELCDQSVGEGWRVASGPLIDRGQESDELSLHGAQEFGQLDQRQFDA